MRKYFIILAVIFAAGAVFVLSRRDSQPPVTESDPTSSADSPASPALIIGDPKAKLAIVEYGDFQCPRCNRFFTLIEPEIRRDFVDKGLVKLEWRNFATIGPESKEAAQAAHCAADQKFFPQFYDAVFNHMNGNYWSRGLNGENVGALSRPRLKQLAARSYDLINQAEFNRCLDSGRYTQAVQAELEKAEKDGFALNTYVIGRQIIQGVQPYSIFKPVIESQL